jgi:hypothetical protein
VVDSVLDVYHGAKSTAPSIVVIAYRGHIAPGEKISPGDEMLEVGVFRLDALPPVAFPSHREALARYAAAAAESASRP